MYKAHLSPTLSGYSNAYDMYTAGYCCSLPKCADKFKIFIAKAASHA